MKSWQRFAGVFFLAISGVVIQQSVWVLRLNDHGQPGSGFMPFGLGVILALLSAWLVVANRGADAEHHPFFEHKAWVRPLLAVAITAAYIVVFDDLGVITSVTVLVAGWLYFVEHKPVGVSALTGAITGVVVYLVFGLFLQTPFPQGLLF
jgi:cell division protein FtsW (lipid II flippase)